MADTAWTTSVGPKSIQAPVNDASATTASSAAAVSASKTARALVGWVGAGQARMVSARAEIAHVFPGLARAVPAVALVIISVLAFIRYAVHVDPEADRVRVAVGTGPAAVDAARGRSS